MSVEARTRKIRFTKRDACRQCYSIAFHAPKIAAEWDFSLNGKDTPDNVTYGSSKKYWWKCFSGHPSYLATPKHRTKKVKPTACPVCSGNKLDKLSSLKNKCPTIADEWNWNKNQGKNPTNIAWRSSQKVWWKCAVNQEHEWEARIADRTRKDKPSGCTHCWREIQKRGRPTNIS